MNDFEQFKRLAEEQAKSRKACENCDLFAADAYDIVDAMLRERGNHSEKPNSSPTLTDEEREAVRFFATCGEPNHQANSLRKLLDRMTDKNRRIRADTLNFMDWILGEGEFSEENLKKARNEFFTKMGKHWNRLMLASMEKAFSDHDAAPEARARDADKGRTDKAVTRPGDGTGNTPSPESYEQGDEKRTNTTTNRDTTRDECSVRGEGTVGQRLVERLSITQTLLDDNEKLRAEIARLREAIRRLADQDATLSVQGGSVTVTMDATLTDAEREAIDWYANFPDGIHAATLRNLLERLHS